MTRAFNSLVCLPLCLGMAAAALAQPYAQTPPGSQATSLMTEDISRDDYLALLARISPAAREGALAYLQAFQRRCGRTMSTRSLRQAVSEGSGDPVLMAMVHASDPSQKAGREASLRLLAQRIRCDAPRAP